MAKRVREKIRYVSQRKFNQLAKASYGRFISHGNFPNQKPLSLKEYRKTFEDDGILVNNIRYFPKPTTPPPRNASYTQIEGMFPYVKRVRHEKDYAYLDTRTGNIISKRQSLNLYTQATTGELYETRYSKRKKESYNEYPFSFMGFGTIRIRRTRKREISVMGSSYNAVANVIATISYEPMQRFFVKHKGHNKGLRCHYGRAD